MPLGAATCSAVEDPVNLICLQCVSEENFKDKLSQEICMSLFWGQPLSTLQHCKLHDFLPPPLRSCQFWKDSKHARFLQVV